MPALPFELTPDLMAAFALMFLLVASMLGGLMRTVFLLLLGLRFIRLGLGAGLLATIAGGAGGYF